VFHTYRRQEALDGLAAMTCATPPLYEFVAADGVGHTLWRADASVAREVAAVFARLPAVYIADGHHRAASAARAHETLRRGTGNGGDAGEHAWFLAVAFPDVQSRILPYNRLVRDLADLTPDRFVEAVGAKVPLAPGQAPPRKGACGMFVAGRWYTVSLQRADLPAGADPIAGLDVSLLQNQVLEPVLKVVDPRTDKRIDFMGGIRGVAELERAVTTGAAAVAFSMFPVTVAELMAIADAGSIMPPKSTWFEPKLRDGLLSHLI
jgi:uncharacterized protein (DUF1015 family)